MLTETQNSGPFVGCGRNRGKRMRMEIIFVISLSIFVPKIVANKNFSVGSLRWTAAPEYPIPKEIWRLINARGASEASIESLRNDWRTRNSEESYINYFKTMLFLEEANERLTYKKFTLKNMTFMRASTDIYFTIKPGMAFVRDAIDGNDLDHFILKSTSDSNVIRGKIESTKQDKIFIKIFNLTSFVANKQYQMEFQLNGRIYQSQHHALEFIKQHELFNELINNPKYHKIDPSKPVASKPNIFGNKTLSSNIHNLNVEQSKAVNDILKGAYYPLPYVLYGCPGTGKTKTLVTAITEIVRKTTKNVLVCVQSNAACDEIAERLTKFLTPEQMLRMYSISRDFECISPKLMAYSNIYNYTLKYPNLEHIYEYRVVICTLEIAGYLKQARCDPRHFSFIIIDECASTHESMALIPIAGLCTTKGKIHARIILSGDPKQLDAVTKTHLAQKSGFSKSWLEQLINMRLYESGVIRNKNSSVFITQLVKNYRSHPKILHIPNKLFYNGALEAQKMPLLSELGIRLPNLKPEFPIIFHSVQGTQDRDPGDWSSFNNKELEIVLSYISELLTNKSKLKEFDIGVVSPYKSQCSKIRAACEMTGFKNVQIGTTENFQGQEKNVMILSSVVSRRKHPGDFVCNPQRMNVMITRAKYLLIIVGDHYTLENDSNWNELITYCDDNKALIQGDDDYIPERPDNSISLSSYFSQLGF